MKHWRQALHLEPPDGWLNDPNGLCRFGGLYHVYFQYSPGPPDGSGPRGWGHFESPDLLHWRCTGTARRLATLSCTQARLATFAARDARVQ